jgi:hypothetical protein
VYKRFALFKFSYRIKATENAALPLAIAAPPPPEDRITFETLRSAHKPRLAAVKAP